MTPPKMATVDEAARATGLSKYAIRALLREGRVHGVRVGRGKLLVNFDDLCRYLNETFVGGDEDDRSR